MSTPVQDPFATPTPRSSEFASADSFRGRLLLVRPTKIERDLKNDNGNLYDKVTANVTVVDGQGPVQVFSNFTATGKYLDGPEFRGVWFGQGQIVEGLQDVRGNLLELVLMRIDTLKPGTRQGKGNPWIVIAPTEDDKNTARAFLANQMVGGASAPTQPAPQQPPAAAPVYAPAPAAPGYTPPPAAPQGPSTGGVPTGPPF